MDIGKKERTTLENAVRIGMLRALYEAKLIDTAALAQALSRVRE